jgi:hypothetical protein
MDPNGDSYCWFFTDATAMVNNRQAGDGVEQAVLLDRCPTATSGSKFYHTSTV